ncbi:MAG TPA: YggS family pyridoxal phosphate-dependent enzyme, partial [Bacteroidales bacterium]|nr:YggS family pyridoxal phosphate-dependent enzyme [Bacteroidales bacterium]
IFGENKVQELTVKSEELPSDIEWHFIGHLQTNKVKYIAPYISMIHAVDSLKLLKTIEKEAAKNKRIINCLLQCKIAKEESKFGLSFDGAKDLLSNAEFTALRHVNIKGVMGMATYTDNLEQVRAEFKSLYDMFKQFKASFFIQKPDFNIVSMGMSHDYKIAIEQGANMIRIGSSIFGERNYSKTK